MAPKYLDYNGLSYFWGKLKNYYQAKLVSGVNIKTINNESLLGPGNIPVSGGGLSDVTVNGTSVVSGGVAVIDLTGYLTTETDPTVPAWAKEATKPSYSASEISGLLDFFYPVGSYYETSDSSFDPNVVWGGTWIPELEGQFHVSAGSGYVVSGANNNVSDGGYKDAVSISHHHYVQSASAGSHTHGSKSLTGAFTGRRQGANYQSHWANGICSITTASSKTASTGAGTANQNADQVNINATHEHTSVTVNMPAHYTDYDGVDGTNRNMPPYIIVYRWHRTA